MFENVDIENLEKNKWGFYEFKNKPSGEELQNYYKEKYFNLNEHNYKTEYTPEELKHKTFVNSLIAYKLSQLVASGGGIAYDAGCGEGFMVNELSKLGFKVKSCDYSNVIGKYFPHLQKNHRQGDIFKIIDEDFENEKFDIITLSNVLEHVLDPFKLINLLKKGFKKSTVLAITVPEDFSHLQNYLLKRNQTTIRWVGYPDHISYFNHNSIKTFLNDLNLDVISSIASFPIEIFLLNDVINYDKIKTKGKDAYSIIRDFDLYLSELDKNKVIKLYESFADLGLGRNITYFCKLKEIK